MDQRKARRVTRKLTPGQLARLRRNRRQIAEELPELTARNQLQKDAADEPTFSGELRRAIHSSPMSLIQLAKHAQITPLALNEFLAGERTLRSDVLDRLMRSLGLALTARD